MSLTEFFTPNSVAVIGASTNPQKLGYAVLENLVQGGFVEYGTVYPINPKADSILDIKAYPSVLEVPDPIDLAVIVIPYPYVPDALRICGEKDIPAVIVISAGFREAGREGLDRELELIEIAKKYNIRLFGSH
jgi:acyl-CoA synthetase (NDP forming)